MQNILFPKLNVQSRSFLEKISDISDTSLTLQTNKSNLIGLPSMKHSDSHNAMLRKYLYSRQPEDVQSHRNYSNTHHDLFCHLTL